MNTSKKGNKGETELAKWFKLHGFCVIPAKGSGSVTNSPDVLAFRQGRQYAFEIKVVNASNLHLSIFQVENLKKWEEITGITAFIVWRRRGTDWITVPVHILARTPRSYSISWEHMKNVGRTLEDLI